MKYTKLADYVIDNAKLESLKVFCKIAIAYLQRDCYDDNKILKALEIISGAGKAYTKEDMDKDKILTYLNKYAYKAATAETFDIEFIDNFTCTMRVNYPLDDNDEKKHYMDIPINEVLESVKE